jgi:MFS family permease
VRVPPASMACTLLLSFIVALPSFGIDMSLPALTAMGAALHVAPAQAGLMMSLFMLGFAVARRSVTVILQPVLLEPTRRTILRIGTPSDKPP